MSRAWERVVWQLHCSTHLAQEHPGGVGWGWFQVGPDRLPAEGWEIWQLRCYSFWLGYVNMGVGMWACPSSSRGSRATTAPLPPPAVDCCGCSWEGGEAGGLVVTGHSPHPPGNSKPWASRVAGWGRHKEGLCAAWLGCPQDSGGGSESRVSVPVVLPAEAAGMPGALAQPGPSGPPGAPSPVFPWAWGTIADFLAVVPDGMSCAWNLRATRKTRLLLQSDC